jgi:23S rRNA pseudouridine1911/1915/1917 synthase
MPRTRFSLQPFCDTRAPVGIAVFSGAELRMGLVQKSFDVAEDSAEIGLRADRIVQTLCGLSRAQVTGLFDHGCVQVNDAVCLFPGHRVEASDRVLLTYDPQQRYHPKNKPRRNLGFEIVFEDRFLIVVIKPPELLTVPTRRRETNTLLDRVSQYVRHVSGASEAFPVHRLDRGVSGLLVLAKTLDISQAIRDQFALRKPERQYVAIVAGRLEQSEGTFDSLLATDRDLNRYSTDDAEIGQRAVTHFARIKQMADTALVRVWLETGRRNQIRVHFAEAGHPVLGDPRYETRLAAHRHWPYKRLALHARRLGLEHPVTHQPLRFLAPLPPEMERFIQRA